MISYGQALQRERVGEYRRRFSASEPGGGIELDIAHFAQVLVLQHSVGEGIVIELAGQPHIIDAIFPNKVPFAFAPPILCLEPIARLAFAERCLCERLKPDAATERLRYLGEQVERAHRCQIAWIVAIQQRDIERVGVEADKEVGALKDGPESGELFARIGGVLVRLVIVYGDNGQLLFTHVDAAAHVAVGYRLNVKGDGTHESQLPDARCSGRSSALNADSMPVPSTFIRTVPLVASSLP